MLEAKANKWSCRCCCCCCSLCIRPLQSCCCLYQQQQQQQQARKKLWEVVGMRKTTQFPELWSGFLSFFVCVLRLSWSEVKWRDWGTISIAKANPKTDSFCLLHLGLQLLLELTPIRRQFAGSLSLWGIVQRNLLQWGEVCPCSLFLSLSLFLCGIVTGISNLPFAISSLKSVDLNWNLQTSRKLKLNFAFKLHFYLFGSCN